MHMGITFQSRSLRCLPPGSAPRRNSCNDRDKAYATNVDYTKYSVMYVDMRPPSGIQQLQSQAVAFGLIKSIIEKRLVCVEVYDVMEAISEHLVSAHS
jgi:hypothetical protein